MVMEKKLTISFDEIKTIRVVCKQQNQQGHHCGGVIEVATDRLHAMANYPHNIPKCPCCGEPFDIRAPKGANISGFQALGAVLAAFTDDQKYSVEIVLPAPD